ncbi:MAG: phage virion morphogenesis protein [Comamonadaceae bacterium]|nr:MAG: phage virion morphogenesis protein [Comamonadaceae bacterium]
MADFTALEDWAGDLLRKLQPSQVRRLQLDIARGLRKSNAGRMRAQTDPDGNRWEARKAPGQALRSKREQLRQKAKKRQPMFAKMRQVRHLKARAQGDAAVVEIAGRAQRIARVHHFGESDKVSPRGASYKYPARELLGISSTDLIALRQLLIQRCSLKKLM